jgi:DNA-binding response OmpR family regulator
MMPADQKRPTVLIIEDDELLSRSLARLLAAVFDVRRARNLQEGLALIDEGDYAALLCDWDLGDGTGDTALARSAERQPEARRVLCTARELEALPDGIADVVLPKPSSRAELIAALSPSGPQSDLASAERDDEGVPAG